MDMDLEQTKRGSNGGGLAPHPEGPPPASSRPHEADLTARPNVEVTHAYEPGVRVAQGMGWFSIGLGLTQILAPRLVSRAIGVNHGSGTLMRLFGVRELAAGLGLLGQRRAGWWMKARVVGDMIDLASLGVAMLRPGNDRGQLLAATAAVLGATALDMHGAAALAGDVAAEERVARVTHVGKAITIDAPAAALYEFWRNFTNLPSVMDHLRRVELLADRRSRWTADGPRGTTVQWEAEIVDDVPGERIAWRTIGGPFESSGSVRFLPAPGGRGTEVVVDMHYQLEGGMAGKLVAMVSARDPGLELARGLRILKQRFELGEPMRSDASIHRGMHPGQPPKPGEKSRLDDQNTPEGAAR